MDHDLDIFDPAKALACFGSESILRGALGEFLKQSESMQAQLHLAATSRDRDLLRQAVHWFRGGLVYLHSPAAERVCQRLDEESKKDPLPELEPILSELDQVLEKLRQRVRSLSL